MDFKNVMPRAEFDKWRAKTKLEHEKSIQKEGEAKPVDYTLDAIDKENTLYKIIFGERSNGKTYAVLEKMIMDYVYEGKAMAYIRRLEENLKKKTCDETFSAFLDNGFIKTLTNGEWDRITFVSGKGYFAVKDGEKIKKSLEPFCFTFSISEWEKYKGPNYNTVENIIFDEFLTDGFYLLKEFKHFMNVISTIVRGRLGIPIYMIGNTVSTYCPYFKEMGLKHIKKMKQGEIAVYKYGRDEKLKVAVEWTESGPGKKSDAYFAFDNPNLKMITGGAWEVDVYPHLEKKYKPMDIVFRFFIIFDEQYLICEIISNEDGTYMNIYPKKVEDVDADNDFIYSPEYDTRPNWRRRITSPFLPVERVIYDLFKQEKVFYATNEVGALVENYLKWSRTS